VFGDEVFDCVSAERCLFPGGEQRLLLSVVFGEPVAQHGDGSSGDWGGALFAALSVGDVDVGARLFELEITDGERCEF